MHEEKKKLMGLFVTMAFILTALWMFPTAARAEDGDDILITEIHVYGENTRLNIGKPYEHTTTLSGPYADAMEIEGQRWVNKDDPEDVIAEGNTDTLTVTDVATGGLKSYSNQDTWNYELLDMDVYGFNDWPSEQAEAQIQDVKDWVMDQGVPEWNYSWDMLKTDEVIVINGDTEHAIHVENGVEWSYSDGDTVDKYITVECTIQGTVPKIINEVEATITTTFEPGKKPSIFASSSTEGVELQFAAWGRHIDYTEGSSELSEEVGTNQFFGFLYKNLKTIKTDGAPKKGWVQSGKNWPYYVNGKAVTGWKQISKKWYYFDSKGKMVTGWKQLGKKWYYFSTESKALGVLQTGWQKLGGKWYFFSTAAKTLGEMQTGWLKSGGKWYYFGGNGVMVTGAKKIGGVTYNFNASGVCLNP